jgi:hypothetical protein
VTVATSILNLDQLDRLHGVKLAAEQYGAAVLGGDAGRIREAWSYLSDARVVAEDIGVSHAQARLIARSAAMRNVRQVASRLRELGRELHSNGSVTRAEQIIDEQVR